MPRRSYALYGALPPRLLAARSRADARLHAAVFHRPTALFAHAGRVFPFIAFAGYYNRIFREMQEERQE